MDQPPPEDGLTDSADRVLLGQLVAGQHTPPTAAQTVSSSLAGRAAPDFSAVRPKRTRLLIVGAVALIFLVGVVLTSMFLLGETHSTFLLGETPSPSQPIVVKRRPHLTPVVKPDLVEIPRGTFEMGRNDGNVAERPPHTITVQTFYMDRTEVTNEEYAQFVREARHEAPTDWTDGEPLPGLEEWPVVNVSPADADAFAAWRSKRDGVTYRLPTEAEWEYAARSGGLYKLYPWGDRWEESRAVVNEANPKPVGSYPEGANRWGVLDLIGNVWEWTSSEAAYYPGNAGIVPDATKHWRVARGSCYVSDPARFPNRVSATYRDWFEPNLKNSKIGFRLVRSVQ